MREMPQRSDEPADDATIRSGTRQGEEAGLSLLIVSHAFASAFPLPSQGTVVIGRGDETDLRIADPSVSRRHAELRIGVQITLTDLGSSNGSRVAGAALEQGKPVLVHAGDTIEIGEVLLLVRERGATTNVPRQTCTMKELEKRLAERCDAGGTHSVPFGLLRVATDPSAENTTEKILALLRPGDRVAQLAPHDHVVFFADLAQNESVAIRERLRRALEQARGLRIGLACFPSDGATPEELLQAIDQQVTGLGNESGVVVLDTRMRELHALVDRIATSPISVLILGETGVGKEVFAERIHRRSDRADKPLLRLNCAALSESLLEAELFGYEKGAFTGAVTSKPGLLETADGGTVFLDEIGDLPVSLQAKLLRVLEDHQVRRVGGLQPRKVDVRVISATHRDLEHGGEFRTDLFYRLNGISIEIPPLRERRGEIAALAGAFVQRSCRRAKRSVPSLSAETVQALYAYAWPGNLRELRNTMERAALLCEGDEIKVEHLPERVLGRGSQPPAAAKPDESATAEFLRVPVTLRMSREEHERELVVQALARTNGNQTRAAELLGIARSTLVKRIEKYNLPRPRKEDDDE
jgi:DNA-binding NtrC family response regulator